MQKLCGKPLTFGDEGQLAELARLRQEVKIPLWEVVVRYTGSDTVTVRAKDEEEAEKMALDMADEPFDMEPEVDSVEMIVQRQE